jgi:hypothetical protein
MFCREQAVQLHRAQDEIESRGGALAFVGNGDLQFAREFQTALALRAPVYVDPSRVTYRALGMRRGLSVTIASPASWKNTLRALRSGFHQGTLQGDPWQNGGLLVVAPGGRIAFRHIDESAGDHAPLGDVLAALAA